MTAKPVTNKMKVLLAEPCWENFGGYFRAISMAKSLARKGIEVDLVIPQVKGIAESEECIIEPNLRLIKATNLNYNLRDRLRRYGFMKKLIKKNNYDIVHTFTIVQPEMVLLLAYCALTRRKRVLDWDDYWQDSPMYKNSGWLTKIYITIAERWVSRLSRHMTVTSDFLSQKTREIGIKNIVKIINGVDPSQFKVWKRSDAMKQLKLDSQLSYLLTFGNSFFHERSYLILKTFGEVLKQNPNVRLISNLDFRELFNDYPKLKKLDKKIYDNVVVVGFIPPERLGLYIAVSECIIFLSGDEDFEKACFPIRVGSYINGEKAIASNYNDTEWSRTVRRYGCAIIGKNPHELSQKIVAYLQDNKAQQRLEDQVKKAKIELSWASLADKLIEFYKTVK